MYTCILIVVFVLYLLTLIVVVINTDQCLAREVAARNGDAHTGIDLELPAL